ncbi:MAG: hypothetical protein WC651_00635 [Candidatus Gracilibacteria bacterium]
MVDYDAIEYYENDEEFGLNFKKPMDPQVLIDAVENIENSGNFLRAVVKGIGFRFRFLKIRAFSSAG